MPSYCHSAYEVQSLWSHYYLAAVLYRSHCLLAYFHGVVTRAMANFKHCGWVHAWGWCSSDPLMTERNVTVQYFGNAATKTMSHYTIIHVHTNSE